MLHEFGRPDTSNRSSNAFGKFLDESRREGFADETPTGRYLVRARGPRRALIAAKVEGRNYDWWRGFCRDYFPDVPEVKSGYALPLIQAKAEARDRLLRGLTIETKTTIVIIDFSEHTASLVRSLYEDWGVKLETDPLDILERKELGPEVTRAILRYARSTAIEKSVVTKVEWLLDDALMKAPVIVFEEPGQIVIREAFDKLDPKAQNELITRFAVIFAEAIDPTKQAELITRQLHGMHFLGDEGNFAYQQLEDTLTADQTFDEGSRPAFKMLAQAHQKMVDVLDEAMWGQLSRRAGSVKEEDSRSVIGIQVADIAAAVAAKEYELATGEVRAKAERVRKIFDRVFLNDKWI